MVTFFLEVNINGVREDGYKLKWGEKNQKRILREVMGFPSLETDAQMQLHVSLRNLP